MGFAWIRVSVGEYNWIIAINHLLYVSHDKVKEQLLIGSLSFTFLEHLVEAVLLNSLLALLKILQSFLSTSYAKDQRLLQLS